MSTQPISFVTPEEYLQAERLASFKSEYVSGQIWAMSGASRAHNTLATNLIVALGTAVKRTSCQVFGSDMRVYVPENSTYAYPDISIVCGPQDYADGHGDTLTNPTVLFEILSPSTAHYDRTVKFVKYRRLPSLRQYVLVHQDTRHIETRTAPSSPPTSNHRLALSLRLPASLWQSGRISSSPQGLSTE